MSTVDLIEAKASVVKSSNNLMQDNGNTHMDRRLKVVPDWSPEVADHYRQAGYWQGITFGQLLRERAQHQGNQLAVIDVNHRWTYQQLDQLADQLTAGLIELGIEAGDRVVVQLPNQAEFFVICFALFRLGAWPIMALPGHRQAEISYFCEFSQAKAYFIADKGVGFDYRALARKVMAKTTTVNHVIVVGEAEEFLSFNDLLNTGNVAAVHSLPEPDPSSPALLQLSGGTTGAPKLIPRTHDDYIYSLKASVDVCRLTSRSKYLCVLPVAHNFPLSSPGTLGTLYAGGTVILAVDTQPDHCWRWIAQEQVTMTALVPPLVNVWLHARQQLSWDISCLEVLQVGGARLSPEVAKQIQPVLGCKLQQVFGMAEGLVNYTRLDDSDEVIIHTQGKPMSLADEIRIVDDNDEVLPTGTVGHLQTRGPYTIQGYFKAPEHNQKAFTNDGYYRTGDRVRLTEQGYLVVEGRAKDQINRGGEKVAAEEIENYLITHPSVQDAALVAVADDVLGEASCAFIVALEATDDHQSIAPPKKIELKRFLLAQGVANYKIPDRFVFIKQFPKTPVGKVNKKQLRALVENETTPV
ncbi:(2,3-dihydroxybenzoyl)adenylate synthase [Zooshikella harenae]|nr:(2,3-dihydroxybenzoyl)adenylate synthase [Zooshikella harenae]